MRGLPCSEVEVGSLVWSSHLDTLSLTGSFWLSRFLSSSGLRPMLLVALWWLPLGLSGTAVCFDCSSFSSLAMLEDMLWSSMEGEGLSPGGEYVI